MNIVECIMLRDRYVATDGHCRFSDREQLDLSLVTGLRTMACCARACVVNLVADYATRQTVNTA